MKIYPIDYGMFGARSYAAALMLAEQMILLDGRVVPHSWRHEWTEDALRKQYAARYRQCAALGIARGKGGLFGFLDENAAARRIDAYAAAGNDLAIILHGGDVAPRHLKMIADLLGRIMPDAELVSQTTTPEQQSLL